jgi:hypothetical protein
MNRRKFLQVSALTPIVLLPETSEAFWGLILRFILRGVVSRVATRTVASSVARAVTLRSLASSAIQAGIVTAVSHDIADLVEQYNAQAVFVRNEENVVSVLGNQKFNLNLNYVVEDVVNGTDSIRRSFYASSSADNFKFDFKITDLPFTGVGRLRGFADDNSGIAFSSPNFVIAEPNQVSYS